MIRRALRQMWRIDMGRKWKMRRRRQTMNGRSIGQARVLDRGAFAAWKEAQA
jgi:hypothetical protein